MITFQLTYILFKIFSYNEQGWKKKFQRKRKELEKEILYSWHRNKIPFSERVNFINRVLENEKKCKHLSITQYFKLLISYSQELANSKNKSQNNQYENEFKQLKTKIKHLDSKALNQIYNDVFINKSNVDVKEKKKREIIAESLFNPNGQDETFSKMHNHFKILNKIGAGTKDSSCTVF